jgi:hypothetical protein
MKKQLNLHGFMEKFQTEEQCLKFLVNEKWGKGYQCRRCSCTENNKGRTWSYRRCKACGYDESATAHTLFHKLKFPLPTAFVIVHQLTTMKKGMASTEIARQHGIHQETAWYFKRKVQIAMASFDDEPLSGVAEVDEAVVGGFEPGAVGRSKGKRKNIQIAVELGALSSKADRQKIKRAKAKLIDDFSAEALKKSMNEMLSKDTVIISDKWSAYPKAKGNRTHLALLSEKGAGMPEVHHMIFNLKNWLRGIHHSVSVFHIQSYLDEYFCRFNNRNLLNSIANNIMKTMMKLPWTPYKTVIAT